MFFVQLHGWLVIVYQCLTSGIVIQLDAVLHCACWDGRLAMAYVRHVFGLATAYTNNNTDYNVSGIVNRIIQSLVDKITVNIY